MHWPPGGGGLLGTGTARHVVPWLGSGRQSAEGAPERSLAGGPQCSKGAFATGPDARLRRLRPQEQSLQPQAALKLSVSRVTFSKDTTDGAGSPTTPQGQQVRLFLLRTRLAPCQAHSCCAPHDGLLVRKLGVDQRLHGAVGQSPVPDPPRWSTTSLARFSGPRAQVRSCEARA
jgi:hypothetical protein